MQGPRSIQSGNVTNHTESGFTVPKEIVQLHILLALRDIVDGFYTTIREAREKRTIDDKYRERTLELRKDTHNVTLHQYTHGSFVNHLSKNAKEGYTPAAQDKI